MARKNLIDMDKAFNRIKRRISKMIYYNENCFCKLHPMELEHIGIILNALYQDYLKHIDEKDYVGIKSEDLINATKIVKRTLKSTIWMLIPQFIDIKTRGENLRVARKYKLNENGLKLIEILTKPTNAEEEEQKEKELENEEGLENKEEQGEGSKQENNFEEDLDDDEDNGTI